MTLIKTTVDGHVLKMDLSRHEKMNAFNLEMLLQLAQAFTELEDNPQLRCGYLYSSGENFTAGLDLAEVGPAVRAGALLFPQDLVDPVQVEGRKRTKPVVIAVQGYCLTIGIELILANDICVAHPDAKFGQIEIKRGIFPFGGATVRMPLRCGWGNAMRYLLTGDTFSGDDAHRIGLVQELSLKPAETGLQIAQRVAAQAPLAVYATLASAGEAVEESLDRPLASLQTEARRLMETADAREGLQSFLERREARFQGE